MCLTTGKQRRCTAQRFKCKAISKGIFTLQPWVNGRAHLEWGTGTHRGTGLRPCLLGTAEGSPKPWGCSLTQAIYHVAFTDASGSSDQQLKVRSTQLQRQMEPKCAWRIAAPALGACCLGRGWIHGEFPPSSSSLPLLPPFSKEDNIFSINGKPLTLIYLCLITYTNEAICACNLIDFVFSRLIYLFGIELKQ